ncbi:MAG: hypothetical protein DRK00_04515 [Thermoprotei archaeon]|nr:MAG: hypothetical protein DRK00_04515 [Thermoprotei archaeon]
MGEVSVLEALLFTAWIGMAFITGYLWATPLMLICALSSMPYVIGVLTGRRYLLALAVALQLPAVVEYSVHAESVEWSCALLLFTIYLAELGDLVARSRQCIDRGYVKRRAIELTLLTGSSYAFTLLLLSAVLPAAGLGIDFGELVASLLLLLLLASLLFSSGEA